MCWRLAVSGNEGGALSALLYLQRIVELDAVARWCSGMARVTKRDSPSARIGSASGAWWRGSVKGQDFQNSRVRGIWWRVFAVLLNSSIVAATSACTTCSKTSTRDRCCCWHFLLLRAHAGVVLLQAVYTQNGVSADFIWFVTGGTLDSCFPNGAHLLDVSGRHLELRPCADRVCRFA
jgi:hypothetical protein